VPGLRLRVALEFSSIEQVKEIVPELMVQCFTLSIAYSFGHQRGGYCRPGLFTEILTTSRTYLINIIWLPTPSPSSFSQQTNKQTQKNEYQCFFEPTVCTVPLTVYNLVKEELKQIRKDAGVKLTEKKQDNSKSKKKKKKDLNTTRSAARDDQSTKLTINSRRLVTNLKCASIHTIRNAFVKCVNKPFNPNLFQ